MKIQIDCASFELERYRQLITDSFNCEPVLTGDSRFNQSYILECSPEQIFPAIGKMETVLKSQAEYEIDYVGMILKDVKADSMSLQIYDDYRE